MSILQMKSANVSQPPIMAVGPSAWQIAPDADPYINVVPNLHVVPLDQLKAVEGAYRGEQLKTPDDLVAGDEFRFTDCVGRWNARCFIKPYGTSIEVFASNRFGPSTVRATITHTAFFMSDTGTLLNGFILDRTRNAADRPCVILNGKIDPALNYILARLTQGRADLAWPSMTEPERAQIFG